MHQQPESPSTALTVGPAPQPEPVSETGHEGEAETHSDGHLPHHVPRWLERVELFLRVMLRMYIGLFACCAPWWHAFWDQNPIFLQYPAIGSIAANGAVRGMVTGLGLLNLWIAFRDAIRHRDG
jgi:hypothetical protein